MHVRYHLPKQFYQLVKHKSTELTDKARYRLQTLSARQDLREAGLRADIACQKLGITRATVYRWQKRLRERNLRGLEEDSRRPRRLRTVSWEPALIETVLKLREQYPRWGKEKLGVLLSREGWTISASTAGRILNYLKQRGLVHDPLKEVKWGKKQVKRRVYALRKPKNYTVEQPGDLVQIDTLDVSLMPGVHFKHFTARDMVSRWDVLQASQRATANRPKNFWRA